MKEDSIRGMIFILTLISYYTIVYFVFYEWYKGQYVNLSMIILKAVLFTIISLIDMKKRTIFIAYIVLIICGDVIDVYTVMLNHLNYDFKNLSIAFHILTNLILIFIIVQMCLSKKKYKIKPDKKIIENTECSICLDDIKENMHTTKCNHIFHVKCINEWCNTFDKNTCPKCRFILYEKKDVSEETTT